jgi:iron complex outermembrane receptor protein
MNHALRLNPPSACSKFGYGLLTASVATVLLATAPALYAAEKAYKPALEEVTVTARKREEKLQDTPIAISAFSGANLEQRGVTQIIELANFSPNMSFQNNPSFGGASNAASIYLRGVGQKEFLPTTEPGVGLYVDGVYIARSVGAILDLVDIAQVEVLRGPQGTLFGRNTIGGAINITTLKPAKELGGKAEVSIGTDNAQRFKGLVDLPLSDQLLSSFSLAQMQQDGYVERQDGVDLGDDDTLSSRANFLWSPNDDLELQLATEYARDRENGPAMSLLGINFGNPIDPDTPPMATIHNVGANLAAGGPEAPCATPVNTTNLSVPGCYDLRYMLGNTDNAGTAPATSESDLYSSNLNISWSINDSLTLKSISAWRDLDSKFSRDGDHSPHRISQFHDTLEQEQITQELQLLGSNFNDRLQWIVGLYYFDESGDNVNTLDFTVSNFQSGGEFENTSQAVFSQATYDLTDKLSVTAGLRYTDEEKSFLPDQYIIENYFAGSSHPLLDAPFMQAGERILPYVEKTQTIHETTPMLNFAYQWNAELMTYASYSEGFKSGGFSQRVFPPQVAGVTAPADSSDLELIPDYDPEFADVYEIGFKFIGLDNRLRLNGAAFHTEYDDLQVQVFTSVAPVTKNAASAKISGWELEMYLVPAEQWFVEASYGWLNPRYDEIDFSETFLTTSNEFERVAERTANASVGREFSCSHGQFVSRLDWSYRSKEYMDAFNTDLIAQDSYDLLNASVSWSSPSETWGVMLALKNINDEDYLITGVIGDAFQTYEGIYSRGREWYLSGQYNF